MFFSLGIGPRAPMFQFAETHNFGVGFNFGLSYTDNYWLPVFFTGKLGYAHFPGSQSLYKKTDYSSISTNLFTMSGGIRYYFQPLIENVAIVMPIVEVGFGLSYFERAHRYKLSSFKSSFVEEVTYGGFYVGGGVSMFLLDVVMYANIYPTNKFLSLDLRIRIPIYMIF